LLTAQAPFDFGHEVFRQPQGIEGLVEGLGGVLRLAAVSREALLCFEAATVSGFRVFCDVSCGEGHGVLLDAVWVFGGCSRPKRT
jgi:hypothetical protein